MNKTTLSSPLFTPVLRTLVLAVLLAGAGAPAAAGSWPWSGEQVEGSGSVKRQVRQVEHFSGIAMEVPGRLELRTGGSDSVTVETDDNLQGLIETVVEDGTLKIRPAKRHLNLRSRHLKIYVSARQVERLSLGGSGSIDADVLRGQRLQFDLGGSGKIHVRSLESESASVTLGGSGDFRAAGGRTRKLSVSIGGSGNVDLGKVQAENASISVAGSGDVTVWARDSLSLTIAGSGDVNYYGDPRVSKSVVGSGDARRLAGNP
ncbi:head GIN domain-containing protein [Massilia niastensis]|uniref:head GIN domain-containing protein n=1 Tax=Massilia niastensis TaxID=544911 RepID=UPI0003707177|nr:head GIN domain-containing protein [Massilia niastensis]